MDEVPKRVLLAHGGGGSAMGELIAGHVLGALAHPALDVLGDSALIDAPQGRIAFTTDSFVVKPYRFPGGDLGRLAVAGTVNDLAVAGARPVALSLACVLPEGLPMGDFDALLASVRATADEAHVAVVTGDTKVMERAALDGPVFTTAGIGELTFDPAPGMDRIRPGDVVIVSGGLGEHAIAVMSAREGLSFETPVASDAAPLWSLVERLLVEGIDVHFMRDPTRGGLAAATNEMVRSAGLGIELDEVAIPVAPPVAAACDMLGLDPLNAANEGKVVLAVDPGDADRAVAALRTHPLGERAVAIGRVVEEPKRVIVRTAIGSSRILDLPYGEELPRIC